MADEGEGYYARVEAHFVERRGSPLFITPGEWDLVQRWEQAGIPLEVVLEGIDLVFERPRSRAKPRKLGYCRQTVEASFRRFREAALGTGGTGRRASPDGDEGAPAAHLREMAKRLVAGETESSFAAARQEIATAVESLAPTLDGADALRLMEAERELAALDARLLRHAEASGGEALREELLAEAARSLAAYRERMPDKVYRGALESGYRRRLRERWGLPPLSLYDR